MRMKDEGNLRIVVACCWPAEYGELRQLLIYFIRIALAVFEERRYSRVLIVDGDILKGEA